MESEEGFFRGSTELLGKKNIPAQLSGDLVFHGSYGSYEAHRGVRFVEKKSWWAPEAPMVISII